MKKLFLLVIYSHKNHNRPFIRVIKPNNGLNKDEDEYYKIIAPTIPTSSNPSYTFKL